MEDFPCEMETNGKSLSWNLPFCASQCHLCCCLRPSFMSQHFRLKWRWTAVSLLCTEACRWTNGGGVHVGRIRSAFNGPVCPRQSSAQGRPSEDTRLTSSTVSDSWRPAVHFWGGRSVHPVPARQPGRGSWARVTGSGPSSRTRLRKSGGLPRR